MKRILGLFMLTIFLASCQSPTVETTEPPAVVTPIEVESPIIEEPPEETKEPLVETTELKPEIIEVPEVETPIEVTEPLPEVTYGPGLSLNRDYEWYIDQETTGDHAYDNCGPTSTVMAIKWYNPDLEVTPQMARQTYRPEGGWWFTTDIESYLGQYGVPMEYVDFYSAEDIVSYIDQGRIVIICLDTGLLKYEPNDRLKTGKYYDAGFGHFIVAKGYQYLDDKLYIEVYDPWSLGQTYPSGELKGKDRLYSSEELTPAIEQWWDYLMVIG